MFMHKITFLITWYLSSPGKLPWVSNQLRSLCPDGASPQPPLPSWWLSEASPQSIVGKTGPSHPSSRAALKKGASGRGAPFAGPQACFLSDLTFLFFPPTFLFLSQLWVNLFHHLLSAVGSSHQRFPSSGVSFRPLPAACSLSLLSAFAFSQARCQGRETVSGPQNVLASFRTRREREFLGQMNFFIQTVINRHF